MRAGIFAYLFAVAATPLAAQEERAVPLENADFEDVGEPGTLPGWFGNADGASGYRIVHAGRDGERGSRYARLEWTESAEPAPFGTVLQSLDATELRNRRVRLTARVRLVEGAPKHLGMWLRVDRPGGARGFFDNMADRPIYGAKWAVYAIEGDVAADAQRVTFGVLLEGKGIAEFDDIQLTDLGPATAAAPVAVPKRRFGPPRAEAIAGDEAPAALSASGAENLAAFARVYGLVRWFHPTDAAASADWERVAIAAIPQVEAAGSAEELAAVIENTFRPYAPELSVSASLPLEAKGLDALSGEVYRWKHTGLGGTGRAYSSVRERIAASPARPFVSGEVALHHRQPAQLRYRLPLTAPVVQDAAPVVAPRWDKPDSWTPAGFDRPTRLAAVIAGWAMLQHFYPYWDTVDVDWNAVLRARLGEAATATDDIAFVPVLERLVEPIADGHGRIAYISTFDSGLPLDWKWVEGKLVITAAADFAEGIAPGMVVETIDGVPVAEALEEEMAQVSGSVQGKRNVALLRERWFSSPVQRTLVVTTEAGETISVDVASAPGEQVKDIREARPQTVAELEPGILYVDLTRWNDGIFRENLDRLAQAEGIVFDLRGYPRGTFLWLEHFIREPGSSPNFLAPVFVAPDGEARYPVNGDWKLEPKQPHIPAKRVFLTDARAVSYSESILGTVQRNSLGPIVGSPTAGANGNRSDFLLPGGYGLSYTGMRVTNADGSLQHIRGVLPDVVAVPTLAGIRAGRDEVLEAGLAELKRQMGD